MEKTIYNLELHEQLVLKNRDVLIERVASGWIYKYQEEIFVEDGEYYKDVTTHIVFVPYDNSFLFYVLLLQVLARTRKECEALPPIFVTTYCR